jgi:hypothetical protein
MSRPMCRGVHLGPSEFAVEDTGGACLIGSTPIETCPKINLVDQRDK